MDVASYLGADPTFAPAEMLDVLKFKISFTNFLLPREERRNVSKLFNPMNIRDLSNFDPNMPWLNYINNILTPDIIQVKEDVVIIVDVPSFITKFSAHLAEANYMLWRVAAASMRYLELDSVHYLFSSLNMTVLGTNYR